MKLSLTTANVLRERLNILRRQQQDEENYAKRDATIARRSKDRLNKTKVEVRALANHLKDSGYRVPAGHVPPYEDPEQTSL